MLDHKSALIIATLHQQLYMLTLAGIECTGCIHTVWPNACTLIYCTSTVMVVHSPEWCPLHNGALSIMIVAATEEEITQSQYRHDFQDLMRVPSCGNPALSQTATCKCNDQPQHVRCKHITLVICHCLCHVKPGPVEGDNSYRSTNQTWHNSYKTVVATMKLTLCPQVHPVQWVIPVPTLLLVKLK